MKELMDKLSSYNIFNYLLPGVLFAAGAHAWTGYKFIQEQIAIGVFVYYFFGLIVSRVGSLAIEPLLRKTRFVHFSEYRDYVEACRSDQKIELLSEVNNMYRTLASTVLLLVLTKGYEQAAGCYPVLDRWSPGVVVSLIFLLLLFSYRKQTNYITRRVSIAKEKHAAQGSGDA